MLFVEGEGVEELAIEVVGFEFKGAIVDPDHAVVVAAADEEFEGVAEGTGGFEMAAATAGDHVDGTSFADGGTVFEGPSALIRMDVAVPHDVDLVLVVEGGEVTGIQVASGAEVGFPEVAVVVFIGAVNGVVVAGEFPFGGGLGEGLIEPLVLFGVGVALFVGIDEEELSVSVGEGVVVFGIGEGDVAVVVVGVLFVVAEDGEEGDTGDEGIHAGEEVFDPVGFVFPGADEIAGVEEEVGALFPSEVGEFSGDFGVALGVADDGEGEGDVRAGIGLEGANFGGERRGTFLGLGDGLIEILGAGFELSERDFVEAVLGFLDGGDFSAFGCLAVLNLAFASLVAFPHHGDAGLVDELEVRFDDEFLGVEDLIRDGFLCEVGVMLEFFLNPLFASDFLVELNGAKLSEVGEVFI